MYNNIYLKNLTFKIVGIRRFTQLISCENQKNQKNRSHFLFISEIFIFFNKLIINLAIKISLNRDLISIFTLTL